MKFDIHLKNSRFLLNATHSSTEQSFKSSYIDIFNTHIIHNNTITGKHISHMIR